MGKVKCHTCGHFSIIRADHGFIKGCYIFNLVDDDDDLYNVDKISQITEGNESATFHKIDTKFILNKNNNCEFWSKQSNEQKESLKKYKKFYWKTKLKRLFKFW